MEGWNKLPHQPCTQIFETVHTWSHHMLEKANVDHCDIFPSSMEHIEARNKIVCCGLPGYSADKIHSSFPMNTCCFKGRVDEIRSGLIRVDWIRLKHCMAKCDHVHFNGSYMQECKVCEAMRTCTETTASLNIYCTKSYADLQIEKPYRNVFCRAHAIFFSMLQWLSKHSYKVQL